MQNKFDCEKGCGGGGGEGEGDICMGLLTLQHYTLHMSCRSPLIIRGRKNDKTLGFKLRVQISVGWFMGIC